MKDSGDRWERIAAVTGKSVADVKAAYEDAGGDLDAIVRTRSGNGTSSGSASKSGAKSKAKSAGKSKSKTSASKAKSSSARPARRASHSGGAARSTRVKPLVAAAIEATRSGDSSELEELLVGRPIWVVSKGGPRSNGEGGFWNDPPFTRWTVSRDVLSALPAAWTCPG